MAAWARLGTGSPFADKTEPEFEMEVWADGARALTNLELFGARLQPMTFANLDVDDGIDEQKTSALDLATKTTHCTTVVENAVSGADGDSTTLAFAADGTGAGSLDESGFPALVFHFEDGVTTVAQFEAAVEAGSRLRVRTPGSAATLTAADDVFAAANLSGGQDEALYFASPHGLFTGDGPLRLATTGVQPAGLALGRDYWFIREDDQTGQLATSFLDAMAGTQVDWTDQGSGTLSLVSSSATRRVHYHSHGLLGPAEDGALDLDAQLGYACRRPHSPRDVGYALRATLGAGSGAVSARLYPIEDSP